MDKQQDLFGNIPELTAKEQEPKIKRKGEEVQKEVKSLLEQHKNEYNIKVTDERVKENLDLEEKEKYLQTIKSILTKEELKKEEELLGIKLPEKKKGKIKVERKSNGETAVFPEIEGVFITGNCFPNDVMKEKEAIYSARKYLIEQGIKEEDILIYETKYVYEEDKPERIEKDIKEYSEKLKKSLAKKFGCPVQIKIFKEEK